MALILSGDTGPSIVQSAAQPTGSVLQVVYQSNPANISSSSTAYVALTQSITPKFSNSKIFAMMAVTVERGGGSTGNYVMLNLARNGTSVFTNWGNALQYQLTTGARAMAAHNYLDSPATTSPVSYTYVIDFSAGTGMTWYFYALNLTLMEIAG